MPDWNKVHGDEVICINELKLGLLGKSCLCPGFSTMVANLIMMSSFQPGNYNVSTLSVTTLVLCLFLPISEMIVILCLDTFS